MSQKGSVRSTMTLKHEIEAKERERERGRSQLAARRKLNDRRMASSSVSQCLFHKKHRECSWGAVEHLWKEREGKQKGNLKKAASINLNEGSLRHSRRRERKIHFFFFFSSFLFNGCPYKYFH